MKITNSALNWRFLLWLLASCIATRLPLQAQQGGSIVDPIKLGPLKDHMEVTGRVDSTAQQAWFEFEVTEPVRVLNATVNPAPGGVVDFYLVGRTGNGQAFNLGSGTGIGSGGYTIGEHWLDTGVYYVSVAYRGNTDFTVKLDSVVTVSPGNHDNELFNAIPLGSVSSPKSVSDFVGPSDAVDWYSFQVVGSVRDVTVTGLPAANGVIDMYLVARSTDGSAVNLDSGTGIGSNGYSLDGHWLDPGTYYVAVYPRNNTRYNLSISSTAVVSPGNDDNELFKAIPLGSVTEPKTASDFVGPSDAVDWYSFQVVGSVRDVTVTGLPAANGVIDMYLVARSKDGSAVNLDSGTGIGSNGYTLDGHWLDPGIYYVAIYPRNNTRYNLSISSTAVVSPGNNDNELFKAIPLGSVTEPKTASDFVGPSDAVDWYSFQVVGSVRDVTVTGLPAANGVIDMYLVARSKDGSAFNLDSGTGIGSNGYALAEHWLDPGTYYVAVYPRNNTRYQIVIESTAVDSPGNANNELKDATSLGSLLGSADHPIIIDDFVGPSDAVDWYRFNVEKPNLLANLLAAPSSGGVLDYYLVQRDASGNVSNLRSATGIGSAGFLFEETLAPGEYYIAIYPRNNTTYRLNLSYSVGPKTAAFIAGQPLGQAVDAGTRVLLKVKADGAGTISYQWYHDEALLQGETGPTLVIEAAKIADAGKYTVKVSNAFGEELSTPATLVVNATGTRILIESAVYLSWDAQYQNWVLQESSSVEGPWTDLVSPLRAVVEDRLETAVRALGHGRFFRLRAP